ncbi:hypothetical protein LguiB_020996 [Lonicera macranthoides]
MSKFPYNTDVHHERYNFVLREFVQKMEQKDAKNGFFLKGNVFPLFSELINSRLYKSRLKIFRYLETILFLLKIALEAILNSNFFNKLRNIELSHGMKLDEFRVARSFKQRDLAPAPPGRQASSNFRLVHTIRYHSPHVLLVCFPRVRLRVPFHVEVGLGLAILA